MPIDAELIKKVDQLLDEIKIKVWNLLSAPKIPDTNFQAEKPITDGSIRATWIFLNRVNQYYFTFVNKDSSNYRALSVFMDHIEDFGVYRLVFNIDLVQGRSLVRPVGPTIQKLVWIPTELYLRLPFLSNSQLLKGVLKDRSSKGVYYREINPVVFEIYLKMAYVTLKLLTSRGYEHMWTLVINSGTDILLVKQFLSIEISEYRGHIRGGHVRDELTPLMIFLTTDFDYRCAKLGTIFTEKRDLTDDEITKVSFFARVRLTRTQARTKASHFWYIVITDMDRSDFTIF